MWVSSIQQELELPVIEERHARIVETTAEKDFSAAQVAEDGRVCFDLRRELAAQLGQRGGGVETVSVRSLVIDDPPGFFDWRCGVGLWRGSGAEDSINLHRAQAARPDSGPADFAGSVRVWRKNPLGKRIAGCLEHDFERLRGDAFGCGWLDACGANGCGNAGLLLPECHESSFASLRNEKLRELLKKRVDGVAERA